MNGLHVFTLAGVPVYVSVWYLVLVAWWSYSMRDPATAILWGVVVTVSILVHEFGHAMVARGFRLGPQVMLHGWGGLCAHERASRDRDEALIVAAGPGAGLLLGGLVWLGALASDALWPGWRYTSPHAAVGVQFLLFVNLLWSLVNLLPLWPLDGGQLFRLALIQRLQPARAERITHVVGLSVAVAGLLWAGSAGYMFVALICVFLAYENFRRITSTAASGAIRSRNLFAEGLIADARAALDARDWREASRLAHQARAESNLGARGLEKIWTLLGVAAERMGDHDDALDYLARAPDSPEVVAARVRSLVALGRAAEARDVCSSRSFAALPAPEQAALRAACHP